VLGRKKGRWYLKVMTQFGIPMALEFNETGDRRRDHAGVTITRLTQSRDQCQSAIYSEFPIAIMLSVYCITDTTDSVEVISSSLYSGELKYT
jgi:hypothetical protein